MEDRPFCLELTGVPDSGKSLATVQAHTLDVVFFLIKSEASRGFSGSSNENAFDGYPTNF